MLRAIFVGVLLVLSLTLVSAQSLPACSERASQVLLPRSRTGFCMELVLHEQNAGELAFTALAVTRDGTLYATRPLYGQLLMLTDADGDTLPETTTVLAEGLSNPNAMVADGNTLYIAGGDSLYRWQDDTLTTLVDDLPYGTGIWNGGIAIWQNRLIVGIGAPCDNCEFDPNTRGLLLSLAMDGTDRQVLATGLRQPTALGVFDNQLWVGDSAPQRMTERYLDEINRVDVGANFGFPQCIGRDNLALDGADCSQVTAPTYALTTHAMPYAILAYRGDAFPQLNDQLLLVLGGSPNESNPTGFELVAVSVGESAETTYFDPLVPYDESITGGVRYSYGALNAYYNNETEILTRRGAGFYPHQPFAIAISPEGWIYVSVSGGRIYVLRPVEAVPE